MKTRADAKTNSRPTAASRAPAAGNSVTDLKSTFHALRTAMLSSTKGLERVTDKDGHLYLNTRHIEKNRKPLFFGAVQMKKGGVSYHLMPLYTHPGLLRRVSPGLKKKMNGKSCFTLSSPDPALIEDLTALTRAAFEEYETAGYA